MHICQIKPRIYSRYLDSYADNILYECACIDCHFRMRVPFIPVMMMSNASVREVSCALMPVDVLQMISDSVVSL